jgi:hypothetical protein
MDSRRAVSLLVLVVLAAFPLPARADRHNMECFAGISPEKQEGTLVYRTSCGYRLVGLTAEGAYSGEGTVPGDIHPARALTDPATGTTSNGSARFRQTLFAVLEFGDYVIGPDSKSLIDVQMLGLRHLILGGKPIEPFFHVLAGRQRPSRRRESDPATPWKFAIAAGGGFDIDITGRTTGIVPVMRIQGDVVESAVKPGFHPYVRGMFGLSFRFEGSGSHH